MHDADTRVLPILRLRPITALVMVLSLATYLGFYIYYAQTFWTVGQRTLIDFDIFYIVGKMVWAGSLADAYTLDLFTVRQMEISGREVWAPWTYPPQFNLIVSLLALMPVPIAFVVFTLGTLAAYLLVLRRISGAHFATVVLTMLPILMGCFLIGQNGFLTGTLVGLVALLAHKRPGLAGGTLGLMIIKPHLAVGLGLLVILKRRWDTIAGAVAVIAGTSALCSLTFGLEIWPAFLQGAAEAKAFLAAGVYRLELMPSIYAGLLSLGVEARVALATQVAVALAALALVGTAWAGGWRESRLLASAILASLVLTPYCMHYDLTLLGVALALSMDDLAAPGTRRLFPVVFGLAWAVPLVMNDYFTSTFRTALPLLNDRVLAPERDALALAGFVLFALAALLFGVLWRAELRRAV